MFTHSREHFWIQCCAGLAEEVIAEDVAESSQSKADRVAANLDGARCIIDIEAKCSKESYANSLHDRVSESRSNDHTLGYDPTLLPPGLISTPPGFEIGTDNHNPLPQLPFRFPTVPPLSHHSRFDSSLGNWRPPMPLQNGCYHNSCHAPANFGPSVPLSPMPFPPLYPLSPIQPERFATGGPTRERRSSYEVGGLYFRLLEVQPFNVWYDNCKPVITFSGLCFALLHGLIFENRAWCAQKLPSRLTSEDQELHESDEDWQKCFPNERPNRAST